MRYQAFLSALLILGAGSALAQDVAEDDWEVIRQPERKAVFAYVALSTGLTIGFRCVDGAYGAIIGGLPEAPLDTHVRPLRISGKDGELRTSNWNVTSNRTAAVADYPASLARRLRDGGPVSIVIPGGAGEGRNLRHNLNLPVSSSAIDETLTACGRPLEDPRDALLPEIAEQGLPGGLTWARAPRPIFPGQAYSEGFVVITCVVQPNGMTAQCEVESEHPLDGGFGHSALRAMRSARVNSPGETTGQYAPRKIGFRINYRVP